MMKSKFSFRDYWRRNVSNFYDKKKEQKKNKKQIAILEVILCTYVDPNFTNIWRFLVKFPKRWLLKFLYGN